VSPAGDFSQELGRRVAQAAAEKTPLRVVGSGSKDFIGRAVEGSPVSVSEHRGIVNYQPKELVLTARTGTPIRQIESELAAQGQMLPFEPPHFGAAATLGGTIACGLSGPRRPYSGSARDYVLGARIVNGRGEILRFGGEVMKNVAGYDLSRLMVGAMGSLGVLLEVSMKVLPVAQQEVTLVQERRPADAIAIMNRWAGQPLPVSAACYDGLRVYVRLSGTPGALQAARVLIGGDLLEQGGAFWEAVREQRHSFFDSALPLWRLSLPPATPPLELPGKEFIDWGGAQRWRLTDIQPEVVRRVAEQAGGHASLFCRGDRRGDVYHPLSAPIKVLHGNLKRALDPQGILNPGRLYADL
jgi:glycolate oxidase FAD binding subunit